MNKKTVFRVLFYVLGMIAIALGVACTIIANVGTGAWDAVSTGLFGLFGLSVGMWVILVAILLIVSSGILLRKVPRLTTLLTSFIIGFFIDVWLFIFTNVTVETVLWQWGIFIVGVFVISLGVALYLVSDLPPSPIDYFMMSVKERFKVSMGVAKIISEGFGVVLAILVKGPIGFGTIIITLCMGYIIEACLKFVKPLFERLTQ